MRRNSCNYILNYLTKQLATNPDRDADTQMQIQMDSRDGEIWEKSKAGRTNLVMNGGVDKLLSVAQSSKQTNRTQKRKGQAGGKSAKTGRLHIHIHIHIHIHMQMAAILRSRQLKWFLLRLRLSDVMPTTI